MSELRKRGLRTAVICSTPFERLGQAQARTFGAPDLPLVMIQHPLGGIRIDEVRARAEQAMPKVLALLDAVAKEGK
jgi:predicted Zn-dependent protease